LDSAYDLYLPDIASGRRNGALIPNSDSCSGVVKTPVESFEKDLHSDPWAVMPAVRKIQCVPESVPK